MICALTGQLCRVDEDRVEVKAGQMVFELLVPASDLPDLRAGLGQEINFHTILDLEGDATRGGLSPRLIGFLRLEDKRFFQLFVTVKGIGPKKALRALSVPIRDIARAIESKDARSLATLEGIGKRMAEQIVASLSGKVQPFVGAPAPGGPEKFGKPAGAHSETDEEAILVCVRLGLSRFDAERLLERVRQTNPDLKTVEALSREMLRLRAGQA
jgi:holliday junction DNA helicase RuvA